MKWSKMECNGNRDNRRDLGGYTYTYACETALYGSKEYAWDTPKLGKIERWKTCGGSIYNAWVVYHGEWVDLGWFDFDPSVLDEKMNFLSSLKELKGFVVQQHTLANKAV